MIFKREGVGFNLFSHLYGFYYDLTIFDQNIDKIQLTVSNPLDSCFTKQGQATRSSLIFRSKDLKLESIIFFTECFQRSLRSEEILFKKC